MRNLKPDQMIVLHTYMTHRAHISHLWLPFLYLTWNKINWVKKTLKAHLCFLKRFNTVLWEKTAGDHFHIAHKLLVIKTALCACVRTHVSCASVCVKWRCRMRHVSRHSARYVFCWHVDWISLLCDTENADMESVTKISWTCTNLLNITNQSPRQTTRTLSGVIVIARVSSYHITIAFSD